MFKIQVRITVVERSKLQKRSFAHLLTPSNETFSWYKWRWIKHFQNKEVLRRLRWLIFQQWWKTAKQSKLSFVSEIFLITLSDILEFNSTFGFFFEKLTLTDDPNHVTWLFCLFFVSIEAEIESRSNFE